MYQADRLRKRQLLQVQARAESKQLRLTADIQNFNFSNFPAIFRGNHGMTALKWRGNCKTYLFVATWNRTGDVFLQLGPVDEMPPANFS